MNEVILKIPSYDDELILGKLTKNSGNKRLIVHCHGMTHNMNHLLEYIAGGYFPKHGYDFYRMSLYGNGVEGRNLAKSTITTHVEDIQTVLDYFQNEYDEIFLIGHSLSGLCALIGNFKNMKAQSLWDPAFDVSYFWQQTGCMRYMPEYKQYQMDYGAVFVVGEAMFDEIAQFPHNKCLDLAKTMKTPTQIIVPEAETIFALCRTPVSTYIDAIKPKSDLYVMKNSNHTFSHMDNAENLMKQTLEWFNKF